MKKLVLFVFMVAIDCSSQSTEMITWDNDIISSQIDKVVALPPPPPLNYKTGDDVNSSKLDSLNRIELTIAIYPVMEDIDLESLSENLPESYSKLMSEGVVGSKQVILDSLSSKKGHRIIIADTMNLKKSKDYEGFDFLLNFSRIYYDKNYTKAVFTMGKSSSQLAGSSSTYCLKKEDGEWVIDFSLPLSIW